MLKAQKKRYISENWQKLTDEEMAAALGCDIRTVVYHRSNLSLYRRTRTKLDKPMMGLILELFSNGSTMIRIARLTGRSKTVIKKFIDSSLMFKEKSINTITLVIESEINY